MATLPQYDRAGQIDRGNLWFSCLNSNSDIAVFARSELNKRNYGGKKDDKGKVIVPDQHAEGMALYAKFLASGADRSSARPVRIKHVEAEASEATALREWVRDQHAELLGIRRHADGGAALSALPSLHDLGKMSGLHDSSADLIAFFKSPAVAGTLAKFGFSAADGATGQALLNAWVAARGTANTERGGETGKTKANMTDREAFVAWLSTWWAIAKVRFRKRPDVLAALGVELKNRRGNGPGANDASDSAAPDASLPV